MDYILKYDDSDPLSIEEYGKKLESHTFAEVYAWKLSHIERDLESYISGSRKGGLGNLIEEQYFCYEANSSPEPDFPKAGVELKVKAELEKRATGRGRVFEPREKSKREVQKAFYFGNEETKFRNLYKQAEYLYGLIEGVQMNG